MARRLQLPEAMVPPGQVEARARAAAERDAMALVVLTVILAVLVISMAFVR
jgi:hypothetical protein